MYLNQLNFLGDMQGNMQDKKKEKEDGEEWSGALVTVYTKTGCVFCTMVLHHLDEMGLEYE